jgi:hypothetical protein
MPDVVPDQLILDEVKLQLSSASGPETQVVFKVQPRADGPALDDTISNFEISGGPADATAYHDYYRLHIAFEHIWTELFDNQLGDLGKELYKQWVDIKTGDDPKAAVDRTFSSVDELRAFMNEIRDQTVAGIPASGAIGSGHGSAGSGAIGGGMNGVLENLMSRLTGSAPASPQSGVPVAPPAPARQTRLEQLLNDLDALLAEKKYAFEVFAPDSVNFGVLVNYRQRWQPQSYQVGNLVSTIPLAPQEIRRYTTKTVVKKTRNVSEIDDSLRVRKQESSETSRVDAEIVDKALTRTNFQLTSSESFGSDQTYKINASQAVDQNQSQESARTKKEFHETVVKTAQEYRDQHRVEVKTEESTEEETTTFHEIRNPNDELPVTYLFYELQRRYQVTESLHSVTPVVLVANAVPKPNEITESWLVTHDWILKRAILDDSFLPALDYLSKSFVGAEVAIQIIGINMQKQKEVVDSISQQVQKKNTALEQAQQDLDRAVLQQATNQGIVGTGSFIKSFFDPLNITQSGKHDDTADKTMVDAAKDALDRAQSTVRDLLSQLETEMTALQTATNKFAKAVEEHFNHLAEVDRLRLHVKDNILYYMQAIWSHEPPDQRYFRLYKIPVPIFHHNTMVEVRHDPNSQDGLFSRPDSPRFAVVLPTPSIDYEEKELNEVADLDNLLGFKGNYMIFPLVQFDYLTYYMMQDYIAVDDTVKAVDPDPTGNYTLDELDARLRTLFQQEPSQFSSRRAEFKKLLVDYLSNKPADDVVIVPTTSLYIEALPGAHPLLEDFKLIHRAIDVKKAQAEARRAELENLRYAARVMKGNDEDPHIEKKIVVEGGKDVLVGS